MKAEEAKREFATENLGTFNNKGEWIILSGKAEAFTTLISEHYYPKEKYDELLKQRDRCLMALSNCRETIEMLQREIPGEQIVLRHEMASRLNDVEAAIQNACPHENEVMRQGDGFVYGTCKDCGKELY